MGSKQEAPSPRCRGEGWGEGLERRTVERTHTLAETSLDLSRLVQIQALRRAITIAATMKTVRPPSTAQNPGTPVWV